jgi:ArsR family transcriptional regulator
VENKYTKNAEVFKALSDPNRIMIIDMLSCGELCACKILEKFKISQPTLSYHMKILCECGLVNSYREGKWMHYSLNEDAILKIREFLKEITSSTVDCICKEE